MPYSKHCLGKNTEVAVKVATVAIIAIAAAAAIAVAIATTLFLASALGLLLGMLCSSVGCSRPLLSFRIDGTTRLVYIHAHEFQRIDKSTTTATTTSTATTAAYY